MILENESPRLGALFTLEDNQQKNSVYLTKTFLTTVP
jgi:hypothetical protein